VRRGGPWLLGALAPAVLLAVDPWGWYPFGPIKWLGVLVLGFGGAGLVLREHEARVPRRLGLVVVAFLAWLAVAAALGDDRIYAWTGTPERHLGVLTWLLCALLLAAGTALERGGVRRVVDGLLLAGLGIGVLGVVEAVGWEPDAFDVSGRLSGTLGSPAYLGAATALLLPIALAHAGRGTTGSRAWVARLAAAGLAVACVGSGARAAWVGLVGAAAVALLARRGPALARLRARPGPSAAGAVLAAVAVGAVVALSPLGGRLSDVTDPDAAGGRGRADEWRVASNVVVDHPVVGVGPEGYRVAFHEGVDARYEREHGRRQQPDRAHSAPLDLALDGGLPLAALRLAIVALVGRRAWAALRDGEPWQRGVAAALVAHVVGQLLLFPIVELEPVAWLLAGTLVASPAPPRTGVRSSRFARRFAPWFAMVVAGLGLVAGMADVVADHRAERAVQAMARGDGPAALAAADGAVDLRPDILRLHLLAARAAVADQRGALAGLERIQDGLDWSPHDPIARLQQLTLLVGRAESTQTPPHIAAARGALDPALRRDPFAAALWRLDARLALLEGDPARSERSAHRADSLTPPDERR
jgi:O-antigen ligase